MQEEYLHTLWKHKRLPMHQLNLTDGRLVQIHNTGVHNQDAGPDFFNGKIEIEGIIWTGNIEMHLKSSDWYHHKHHKDQSYSNTVLHVVLDHDQDVIINKRIIPTLELKNYIDTEHHKNHSKFKQNSQWIPCQKQIKNIEPLVISDQIQLALLNRLNRKADIIDQQLRFYRGDVLSVHYELFAKTFGLRVNELPFLELISNTPLSLIWKVSRMDAETIMLGVGGFFQDAVRLNITSKLDRWQFLQKKHGLFEMEFFSWKYKGLRPVSFPHLRVQQFAAFCNKQDFFRIHELNAEEIVSTINTKFSQKGMIKHQLIINAIAPFLWWYGRNENNIKFQERSLELLTLITPEDNAIITKWKKLNLQVKSSYDSQGLLELKNEFCTRKKCLSCKIGFQIL